MTIDTEKEEQLPEVVVEKNRWPSPIWLIPIVAALVGLWLLVQFWLTQGETITVRFPDAEGIQAGTTEVRYKAVTVGKVKRVALDEELNPLVTLSLSKDISQALTCRAQFWVVRPRVRGTQISGISTLFSGTYISMMPDQNGNNIIDTNSLLCYEVLDEPPVVRPNAAGREYTLVTERMGSLDVGAPVLYKQLEVGELLDYRLSDDGKIEINIFIEQPYHKFINANTRFWNASGAEFNVDSAGAEFRMESLTSLLAGGVAFETPAQDILAEPAVSSDGMRFELFSDYKNSQEKQFQYKLYYTLYFNGSIRGLAEGAPVEFQGIRVGEVEKIKMHLDADNMDVRIPVLIAIEPQRFSEEIALQEAPQLMSDMVARGMRASLQSGNLLTGQKFVSLEIEENAKPAVIEKGQFFANFPTSSSPAEELSAIATNVAEDFQATLAGVREFLDSKQLDNTVANFNTVLDTTRDAVTEARQVLKQLNQDTLPVLTANVSRLTDRLDKETLPRLTQDVSRITDRLDKETLPRLTQDVSRLTNRLDKETLPRLTQDVSRITKRLDEETLPRLNWNISRLTNRLDTETLPRLTQDFTRMTGTMNNSLQRVTATVEKTSGDFARASLQLNKTMQRLQNTLTHMDRITARNSPTQHQLMEMMEELTRMSRAVRTLTETLQQQPEALIRGRR